jgi:hypothetical protein
MVDIRAERLFCCLLVGFVTIARKLHPIGEAKKGEARYAFRRPL